MCLVCGHPGSEHDREEWKYTCANQPRDMCTVLAKHLVPVKSRRKWTEGHTPVTGRRHKGIRNSKLTGGTQLLSIVTVRTNEHLVEKVIRDQITTQRGSKPRCGFCVLFPMCRDDPVEPPRSHSTSDMLCQHDNTQVVE